MSDPIPVIPLEYAKPAEDEGRLRTWRWVNRSGLIAGAAVTLIGWVMLLIHVETVLFSGPLLLLVGLAMVTGGFHRRQPFIWGLGSAHCAICVLFIVLVNLLNWSPSEAAQPFAVMCGAYNLLSIPATIWAWVRRVG